MLSKVSIKHLRLHRITFITVLFVVTRIDMRTKIGQRYLEKGKLVRIIIMMRIMITRMNFDN